MNDLDLTISLLELMRRIGAALFAGILVGWEREWRKKPAGLRTHMLVSLGSATFTIVAFEIHDAIASDSPNVDPLRIVEGLVGGIGFLGAGTILQDRDRVRGITTAANIWLTGAVGVCCGLGLYVLAGVTIAGAVLTVAVLGFFTHSSRGDEEPSADSTSEREAE
ncbi:MAG: MgtC/SapB family protein [Planctomycetota bacterium]